MPDVRDEYGDGYGDGRDESEYQKAHGVTNQFIRDIGYSPRRSNSSAYNKGFDKGVKDGWDSGSSNSGK
jgi:hypothetical protein